MMLNNPPNSLSIAVTSGADNASVTVRSKDTSINFKEVLPYCSWRGMWGMSFPAFASFTVPSDKVLNVIPDLIAAGFDIGEAQVVSFSVIRVDIKDMVELADVLNKLTETLELPANPTTDLKQLDKDLHTLTADDYLRIFKSQNPNVSPTVFSAQQFPENVRVYHGFKILMINGDKFRTVGERNWWKLDAVTQQLGHQSNDPDAAMKLLYKVIEGDDVSKI